MKIMTKNDQKTYTYYDFSVKYASLRDFYPMKNPPAVT